MEITKKLDMYLKTETTTTGDIALPPDKASTKTKAGRKKDNPNKDKKTGKKNLLLGKDKKSGGSS